MREGREGGGNSDPTGLVNVIRRGGRSGGGEQRSNRVSECYNEKGEEGNSDPTGLVSVIRRGEGGVEGTAIQRG